MDERFIGIDAGAETLKVAELVLRGGALLRSRTRLVEHGKEPAPRLLEVLAGWDWDGVAGAAVCGRLGRAFALPRVPEKQARAAGWRLLHPDAGPVTLVSIGSHGFSVLELRGRGVDVFRSNSRCSQGTGNFLRQLVERFGLTVGQASELTAAVEDPSPLSGRCPVILKTDMTHLANLGQSHERILAGLFDAVAENVQVLVKPRLGPRQVALLGGVSRAPRLLDGVPAGFEILVFSGIMASDMLLEAYYDVRPAERTGGAAQAVYDARFAELTGLLEEAARGDISAAHGLAEVATGRLFGCGELMRRAAREFEAARLPGDLPTVLVVGEIYVRCDPFANDFVIERLLERGIRVRLAPFNEWLDYQDHINVVVGYEHDIGSWIRARVQRVVRALSFRAFARVLGWPSMASARESVAAAAPYLRDRLEGEAVLTLGGPLHEWAAGHVDGVLSVGPLECMPAKIAEAQFFHAAEREGVFATTLLVNGDPIDGEAVESFVYEVKARHRARRRTRSRRGWRALAGLGRAVRERLVRA